jgi:Family of unknown function (DUF6496)
LFFRAPNRLESQLLVKEGISMPEKEVVERARRDALEGKAPSTQAGEFVREEFEHVREGKHGARSPQQAIAIGLSKARRAGVKLPLPKKGRTSAKTRRQAARDLRKGRTKTKTVSAKRSRAVSNVSRAEVLRLIPQSPHKPEKALANAAPQAGTKRPRRRRGPVSVAADLLLTS